MCLQQGLTEASLSLSPPRTTLHLVFSLMGLFTWPMECRDLGWGGLSSAFPACTQDPKSLCEVLPFSWLEDLNHTCSQVVISCCLPKEAQLRKDSPRQRWKVDLTGGRELRKTSLCRCCCQRSMLSVLKLWQVGGCCPCRPFSCGSLELVLNP